MSTGTRGAGVIRSELAQRRHVDLLRTSSALCPEG
ncbi:putative leader peptide [Geodermatophilus sp. SYSU D00079]